MIDALILVFELSLALCVAEIGKDLIYKFCRIFWEHVVLWFWGIVAMKGKK